MFNFKNKEDVWEEHTWDGRAGFANRICKLIYDKYEGDTDKIITSNEFIKLYNDLDEWVRNIYEVYDSKVPLISLYELKEHGADNYGYTDEEYTKSIDNCIEACKKYYL